MPRVISDGRRIPAFSSPRARGTSYRGLIGSPVDIQTTNKAIAGTSNEPYRICPERSQLNLLGKRQPANYGYETLADVEADCRRVGQELSLEIEFHQSNAEYQIIDWIHEAREQAGGIVINPAAFTHTSVAILDAQNTCDSPIIEVHISNVHKREAFRHHSYVSLVASGVIAGFGTQGYRLALQRLARLINEAKK